MHVEKRTTDSKGRVVLPKAFANTTVFIEQVSDAELRVRRVSVISEDELAFAEEFAAPLSNRDRERFLELIDNPPAPTSAIKKAASRHKERRCRSRRS
jgi:hypothetical protein